ncbi:MAG: hypothetical protein P8Y23_18620, partial [Candidatus Lokiarchaeota archaeon]
VNQNKKNIDELFDEDYINIQKSLIGLKEIFDIYFFERDIYKQLGIDNLKALHNNIIELLKHTYSPREVRIKLREIEYDDLESQNSFLSQ